MTWQVVVLLLGICSLAVGFVCWGSHLAYLNKLRADRKEDSTVPLAEILGRLTELEAHVTTLNGQCEALLKDYSTIKAVLNLKQIGR